MMLDMINIDCWLDLHLVSRNQAKYSSTFCFGLWPHESSQAQKSLVFAVLQKTAFSSPHLLF